MSRWTDSDATAHLPALRRYARSLTLDPVTADDLVQQALLSAYERASSFRDGAALRPWLFAILHNQFVSCRRRIQAEQRALDAFAEQAGDSGGEAEEQAAVLRDVSRRFARLPESQRAVMHLVAVEGLTYQQAADALAVPIGTIMSRLSRARAALREPAAASGDAPSLRLIGGRDA
jgi:RNA polymerase sigma-70 factor, ECF subfamily